MRPNFIEHRVQSDVKRVRMEARSNVPSAKTTPQPSLDNDEPPHGRRGRKSTLKPLTAASKWIFLQLGSTIAANSLNHHNP